MVEIKAKFGGDVTIFLGAGGSSKLVGGGAGGGVYISFADGKVSDFGLRAGVGLSPPSPTGSSPSVTYAHGWSPAARL